MRIGELANRTGLTRDAIRFYERAGLIQSLPGDEATNTYRDYPEHLVEDLVFIAQAREAGLSVSELKEMNDTLDGDEAPALEAGIKVIEDRIQKTERTLAFLLDTQKRLQAVAKGDKSEPWTEQWINRNSQ
ncbi:MerR family transcriptional regulator [Ruegeria sp. Ofav3-42]|uniref:MerR family transcriptional regulator n=1 Tax=Ruegeria sp. Ofav3-42 TaxID=2917759 RepID=UPI001EF5FA95|nr:MerR family transcriptional regulator [Ruegeria sp. Ofav3-42]MCG7518331.1 MerR family transcriptional regulator [Ruegeria sp. Ofav3-42]